MWELALLAGLAGVLSLDRAAFLQSMASRPLAACAVAGAIVGETGLGVRCGLILELLWLMELPVGAWVPPDDTLVAILAVAFSAAAPPHWSLPARSTLGVLTALPFGVLGRQLDVWVRRWNAELLTAALDRSGRGSMGKLHLLGAARFSLAGALAGGLGCLGGCALISWVAPQWSREIEIGLDLAFGMLLFVGVGAVWAALRGRTYALWFGAGLLGGLGLGEFGAPSVASKVPWPR